MTSNRTLFFFGLSLLAVLWTPSQAEFRWTAPPEELVGAMQRFLAIGDFQSINEALESVQLIVPNPAPITTNILFPLTIEVSNLVCEQINIGDLQTEYTATNTDMNFQLDLFPFSMTCYGNYAYNYGGFVRNSGTLTANIGDSRVLLGLGFTSEDFAVAPPNATQVSQCSSDIRVDGLMFSGELENVIANLFRDGVQTLVSDGAESGTYRYTGEKSISCWLLSCRSLHSFAFPFVCFFTALCEDAATASSFLDDLILKLNGMIEDLSEPITPEQSDPLANERELDLPAERITTLIQLIEGGGPISKTIQTFLDEADQMLGQMVDDPKNPNTQDLTVNIWLRDYLLDSNRMFSLDLTELGIDSTIFETHNKVFAIKIDLNSLKIKGLDTLKVFNPLDRIGNYTVQNDMAWEQLSFEVELVADYQTSTLPDSLLLSASPVQGRETATLSLDMQDVQVSLAALMALLEDEIGNTEIGSLLRLEYVLPCLANTVAEIAVSSLSVSLGSLSDPVFSGIGSPGVARLISSITAATFAMYKPLLLRAIPGAFQGPIKKKINENYIEKNLADPTCTSFVRGSEASPYLDFRDLLHTRSEALELGGSGETPYGSTIALAWKFAQNWLLTPSEASQTIPLNSRFIAPFTEEQSGTSGSILYDNALIDQQFALLDAKVKFRLFDLYAENLDTIGEPLSLLDTVQGEAHMLKNVATVGVDRPLRAGAKINFQMEGNGTFMVWYLK